METKITSTELIEKNTYEYIAPDGEVFKCLNKCRNYEMVLAKRAIICDECHGVLSRNREILRSNYCSKCYGSGIIEINDITLDFWDRVHPDHETKAKLEFINERNPYTEQRLEGIPEKSWIEMCREELRKYARRK